MKGAGLLLLTVILTGCVTPIGKHNWPTDIPPQSDYVAAYAKDQRNQNVQTLDEYLIWVVRFYEGTSFYRRGWNRLTTETVDSIDNPQDAAAAQEYLSLLGKRISQEWPKAREIRSINTRHMSIWGMSLMEALRRDEPLQLMDRVCLDVADLISGKLSPGDIHDGRYYPTEPDDIFSPGASDTFF